MNWIRIAVGLPNDPRLQAFALDLGVSVAESIGLFVCVLVQLPEHARDGNLHSVPDETIERWANWRRKRGRFAVAFRHHFCADGTVRAWEKHNGAAIREADAARIRMANNRKKFGERSANGSGNVPGDVTGRDVTVRTTELPDTNAEGVQYLSGASGQRAEAAPAAPPKSARDTARSNDGKPARLTLADVHRAIPQPPAA